MILTKLETLKIRVVALNVWRREVKNVGSAGYSLTVGCASLLIHAACMHYMPDKEPVFVTAKVAEAVFASAKKKGGSSANAWQF